MTFNQNITTLVVKSKYIISAGVTEIRAVTYVEALLVCISQDRLRFLDKYPCKFKFFLDKIGALRTCDITRHINQNCMKKKTYFSIRYYHSLSI